MVGFVLTFGSGKPIEIFEGGGDAFLHEVERRLAAGYGFSVATLNLDHVEKLGRSERFRAAYAAHSHVVADGNPIVWASRLAGRPATLMPGADMIHPLAAIAARQGVPVALLGATERTLERAAERLRARHPGLRIVSRHAPKMGFDAWGPEGDAAIEALRESGARLVFLALGAPRQRSSRRARRRCCPRWASCRSARVWTSSPARSAARRAGCGAWRWSGCGARRRIRSGWPSAISAAACCSRVWR